MNSRFEKLNISSFVPNKDGQKISIFCIIDQACPVLFAVGRRWARDSFG